MYTNDDNIFSNRFLFFLSPFLSLFLLNRNVKSNPQKPSHPRKTITPFRFEPPLECRRHSDTRTLPRSTKPKFDKSCMKQQNSTIDNHNQTNNTLTPFKTETPHHQHHSFIGPIPEFTRGSSAGAGSGKGHVKSASVSSPGPSADSSANSAATTDPLRQRYIA